MLSLDDTKAMVEVLEYLKGVNEDDINKISPSFIKYLENNASKDYKPNIDYTKPLSELKLMPSSKQIITFICYKYWCNNDEERQMLEGLLSSNDKKYVEEDVWDSIFVKDNEQESDKTIETSLVEKKKKSLFERIIYNIKKLLRIG